MLNVKYIRINELLDVRSYCIIHYYTSRGTYETAVQPNRSLNRLRFQSARTKILSQVFAALVAHPYSAVYLKGKNTFASGIFIAQHRMRDKVRRRG